MANKRKQLLKPEEDEKLLLAFKECKDGEMRTKIQAVRLYGNNVPVVEITNLTGLPRRTINRCYRSTFNARPVMGYPPYRLAPEYTLQISYRQNNLKWHNRPHGK